ncbi:MAG: gliding motility-associated C-terminal domain-containing protein [Saprospiraceae bacterium]|nr:gliding motility-associated C-terminal domain-containing protein [Saprospiraceae bacterium]
MKNFYLLVFLFFIANTSLIAQQDCCEGQPVGGGTVSIGGNSGNGQNDPVSSCSCLATNEHDSYWFTFTCTASGTFEMMITPANLGADFDFALYANECPCGGGTVVVSCNYTGPITPPGPFVPTGIASNPMGTFGVPGLTEFNPTVSITAGTTYYLIADNITANGNGFDIQFAGTAVIAPPAGGNAPGPTPMTGTFTACPGATVDYMVPANSQYTSYEWTVDPPTADINVNGQNTTNITFTSVGTYNVCVNGVIGCNDTQPTCKLVQVNDIVTQPVNDVICQGGSFFAPDGIIYTDPGSYVMNFQSWQGCDSNVVLNLQPIPTNTTTINAEVCDGDCYSFGSQTVCQTGIYSETLQNFEGCDSTVIVSLIVTPNDAVITGDSEISCVTGSTILSAESSVGGSNLTYQWRNGSGVVVGTEPFLAVTQAGNYTLTISSFVGNSICTDQAEITITAPAAPNASATGGTISCTSSAVTINGNSTTSGVSYSWTGPGGFTSPLQNPSVSVIGTYVLTVTSSSGCTATASAVVNGNSSLPNASATGGTVDCDTPTLSLQGNSTTPNVTYAWTGPGGYTSNLQNPTGVGAPGTYTLTVTSANGCSAQASALVSQDNASPNATATGGGAINCTNTSLSLQGSSTTTGVSYAWTGPKGYTSALQNPSVNAAGTYVLTVTGPNGCTASDNEVVTSNQALPDVAATGGTLNCSSTSIAINGSSATPGVTWAWVGPGGFNSILEDPSVTVSGTYTLTVTAANGCTASTSTNVALDNAQPNASATGGILTCTSGSVALAGSSTSSNINYGWAGPGGYTSNVQNPTVTASGIYVLTVTAANGCTASASAVVQQDAGLPDVSASVSGELTCLVNTVSLSGNSTSQGVTLQWSGPGGFSSTDLNPVVNQAGTYTLTATSTNSCTSQALATVILNDEQPDIQAVGGLLTCAETSIILDGGSSTAGVTYAWAALPSGTPMGSTEDLTVTSAGLYELTVTGTNGCTAAQTVQVTADANTPSVTATAGSLDCSQTEALLNGSSTTAGVSFEWTGPGGFIAQQADTSATLPGTYTLTVAAPNGCFASQQVVVNADTQAPNAQADGGIISCGTAAITLMGSSQTTGVTWSWTGPGGFTSNQQNPSVSVPGTYMLTVTAPNGCKATDNAIVAQDANAPTATATGGTVSCAQTSLQLTGASSVLGVTWAWTGPGGFISNQQNPTVSAPGTYTLTITAGNGCQGAANAQVVADNSQPNASATGGTLTCTSTGIALAGNSTTQGVSYAWTGPGGFTSNQQNPTVTAAGAYVLTVTAVNGCTATATATVNNDSNLPNISAFSSNLNCNTTSVVLNGGSTTANVTYLWTGPGGFSSDQSDPTTSTAGQYTLTVTAPNGCSASMNVNVAQNTTPPNASANGGNITCTNPNLNLQGSSTTQGSSYAWTGPNGFASNQQNPSVSQAGTYTLTVTGVNGCTATATATVTADAGFPVVTTTGGTLTCTTTSVQLTGNSSITAGITWAWTGPGGFTASEQNPSVTVSGNYTLTVTTTAGCSSTAQAIVGDDTAAPTASIAPAAQLDCVTPNTTLDGTGSSTGIDFVWSTQDGHFLSGENSLSPTVDAAGTYVLTLTAPNGCTDEASVLVAVSDASPNGAELEVNPPLCFGDGNGSIVVGQVSGGTPPYSYSLNNGAFGSANTFPNLPPGTYTLTVSDATGCTWQTEIEIVEPPLLTLDLATDLQAEALPLGESVVLQGQVSVPAGNLATVAWTPQGIDANCPNCLNLTVTPTITTNYSLTVADENGCSATDQVTVIVKVDRPVYVPNAFSPNDDGINDRLTVFAGKNVTNIKSFLVFDRWGEVVHQLYGFQPNQIDLGWDGKSRGETLDPAVFIWFAEVEFVDGKVILYKGDVSLVR